MKTPLFAAGILALSFAGQALAVRVESAPAPKPDSVRQENPPSASKAAANADDRSSLREGVITAVSDKRDQVEINGSWLKVVDGQTRVFRQGRSVRSGDELVKGRQVKFTLAPGSSDNSTLGVVYVP